MAEKAAHVYGPSPADRKDVSFLPSRDNKDNGSAYWRAKAVTSHLHCGDGRPRVYMKRDLLLGILSSPHIPQTFEISRMSDEKLSEELHKRLKGKRYLIVMDDIWSTGAWDDLKRCFPNDNCGSRILITTRNRDVVLIVNGNKIPHDLRFLSNDESWDLLQEKVFQKEMCPPELIEVGKHIAEKCQGLPLAIVVIGGLLAKTEKAKDWWNEVGNSIRAYLGSDPNHCMETLELSYNHLPDHLKPCFLYFAAFPEDYEIPVSRLTWIWVAEGFVVENGDEVLEDTSIDYSTDLVERSLTLISNKRSNGGVKTCRIHDLLRNLCLKKAEEENFIRWIETCNDWSLKTFSFSSFYESSRLSIHSCCGSSSRWSCDNCSRCLNYVFNENLPSERHASLYCILNSNRFCDSYIPVIAIKFHLLRVVDFGVVSVDFFRTELEHLVHLRYLAFRGYFTTLPKSIFTLQNLETLIFKGLSGIISVVADLCRMVKLRHLHIDPCAYFAFTSELPDLQTLSTPSFTGGHSALFSYKIPNLRKLRCVLRDYNWYDKRFDKLEFLWQLEQLKMSYNDIGRYAYLFDLPRSLKRLTLSKFRFGWSEISKIARLPNLEVLKLLNRAFEGKTWDTSVMDSEYFTFDPFPNLKVLKLDTLNIEQWSASSHHFPKLQVLVLNRCRGLEEIPSDLGDIPTLEMIELNWSSRSATDSAKQILEVQRGMGNAQLKILVYPEELKFSGFLLSEDGYYY